MILGEGKAESEARGRTYENVGLKQRQRSSPPLPKLTDREATSEDEDDVYYHIGETKVRKGERRLVCTPVSAAPNNTAVCSAVSAVYAYLSVVSPSLGMHHKVSCCRLSNPSRGPRRFYVFPVPLGLTKSHC